MGSILYSNCSTITTGCYIYNDIYKTSPVNNGYYSDGTNCYDVQWGNGYVNSVSTCSDCTSYTVFDVPDSTISEFSYVECISYATIYVTLSDGGDEAIFCAIKNSIVLISGNIEIFDNGPCTPPIN
jgi:hypothetical protein